MKSIYPWDVVTGEFHHTLEGHRDGVHHVEFSPNGKPLDCGGGEGAIDLWNNATVIEARSVLEGVQTDYRNIRLKVELPIFSLTQCQ